MQGIEPLKCIPIHLGDLERSNELYGWIKSWWGIGLETLNNEGWFDMGQGQGAYLWAPDPAATEIALELMMGEKFKRPYASHVMIVPRLATYLWIKQLGKGEELLITLPIGPYFWNMEHHEPMILHCLLPVVKRREWLGPWVIKGSKLGRRSQDRL